MNRAPIPSAVRWPPWLVPALALACGTGKPSGTGDASDTTATSSPGSSTSTSGTDGEETGTTGGSSDTAGPDPIRPGPDATIPIFSAEPVYFLGDDNRREVDVVVEFPAEELAYDRVSLSLTLGCPDDRCDFWDRLGWIGIVRDPGGEDESILELVRFMTPYRVGASWEIDLTAVRPLLAGEQTVRVHIDTWVGPGHEQGDGWLVDATTTWHGGIPSPRPIEVLPLWDLRSIEVGDPAMPTSEAAAAVTVPLPSGTTALALRSILTGHGQGNADNCAEFCQKAHGFLVGDMAVQQVIWRDDCAQTPVEGQQGTWTLSRAGWCPGADVLPWVADVTSAARGSELTVEYGMAEYENTCRPDAATCTGCVLGTGCEYDGGNHTPPTVWLSALLVAYGE